MNGILLLADSSCNDLRPIISIIKNGVMPIFQIGIPILLILFGTIDLGKAVIASDDKAIKESTSKLIKRCVAAVAVFFVVTIVRLITNIIADNANDADHDYGSRNWASCWDKA